MRQTRTAVIAAIALAVAGLIPAVAAADPGASSSPRMGDAFRMVQHYGPWPQDRDDRWDRRQQWRERREQREEARIAEAIRRETQLIEEEREQRRAWRHARREQEYGYRQGW